MADKELDRVRSRFVNKVSKEVISQLLDGLLHDGVLNDGEKDAIIEENDSRADKARCLIDKVKRKGHDASSKMITHLKSLDETLFCELGLSNVQPALPAAAGPVDQSGSTPSVSSVEEFWKSKENDPEVYPVTQTSFRNRVALLITNIKFSEKSMNRRGAEKDEENMEKLLSNLGYEVVKYTNLTGKAIDEALIDFTKHPKLKHTDSVFVVLMSHGKLGKILGVDWKKDQPDEFPINNIFKHLGSKSCPELRDKPKVIIIQACRGEQGGSVLVNDGPNTADHVLQSEDLEADKLQFVHKEKNFISLLSCTPDTVSYRQPDYGSLLIQYIVKVFTPESYKKHIYELFRKVLQHVEEFMSREKLQMPTIDRCTLTKDFYLFQGLLHNNH
ncbi:caspase a-like isoform X2 [Gambusia affinis]|uniref:caspase a-like isoform X2 n=1 Tax=Gambusia affinis TaxID=33528 RepID=UPI001CDD83ED|nr:caspase a-like isoform X2 [Gambusia affinis]